MRKFEPVKEELRKVKYKEGEKVLLPLRSTKTSAGYDFYATQDVTIRPQEKVFFSTDVKAMMGEDEWLLLVVRSSKGIKDDLMLANTIGVIDSDYYSNPENDGNIGICLRNLRPSMKLSGATTLNLSFSGQVISVRNNGYTDDLDTSSNLGNIVIPIIKDLSQENSVHIAKGERIMQGIFVKYSKAENCNSDSERTGGTGSTGR